jgi:hypothetical protein
MGLIAETKIRNPRKKVEIRILSKPFWITDILNNGPYDEV